MSGRPWIRLGVWIAVVVAVAISAPPYGCRTSQAWLRVKIQTYNIHHGEGTDGRFDLERLAQIIREADVDLVALQEVDRNTARCGGVDQPAELARLTGMNAFFAAAMPYNGGGYGELVLSRFPIVASYALPLPARPDHEPRVAAVIVVRPPGGTEALAFAGTHLDHTDDPTDRIAQARALVAAFSQPRVAFGPEAVWGDVVRVVIAGDLNAEPESAVLQAFAEYLDVAADAGPTFPSHAPRQRIDYILTRDVSGEEPPISVLAARVLSEPVASDHAPVVASFSWKSR